MFFAIHAYEDMYQALHGIEDYEVVECDTLAEAESIACDMARDLINSYSFLLDEIEEEAIETDCDVEDLIRSRLCYEIYPIKEGYDIAYLRGLEWDVLVEEYID